MHKITFISTVHKEVGKCNANELYNIIKKVSPEVVFLEALNETYSSYEQSLFSSFGVYHKKLEIKAIQKYGENVPFKYIPVLDKGLSDSFERKYSSICENIELQNLLDDYNSLAIEHGFQFLNSAESIRLHEKMRKSENCLLNNRELNEVFNDEIDAYENSMIRNIYSYCRNIEFKTAIFM